jgi:hypothetical protein
MIGSVSSKWMATAPPVVSLTPCIRLAGAAERPVKGAQLRPLAANK